MAPIRVGILGLSASPRAGTYPPWANAAHLPYLIASPHYEIVALANSSRASAETTISTLGLPATVKAYGTPEDIARDSNVDLIVVSVNVALHKQVVWPAIAAKKDVFVEWPLGANLKEGQEIAAFAKEKGVKVAIGLQARLNPDILKIRELVQSGKIGKVLSTTLVAATGVFGGQETVGLKYFMHKEVGGNLVTIFFGHMIDAFEYAVGQFTEISALAGNLRPTVDLVNAAGEVVEANYPKDTHDQILLQGTLASGAVASVHVRGGAPPPDGNMIRWYIYGTKGQIEVTSNSPAPQMSPKMEIVYVDKDGKKEVLEVDHSDADTKTADGKHLTGRPANVARIYEAFRRGETERFASFEDAVELHNLIDKLYKSSDVGRRLQVKL